MKDHNLWRREKGVILQLQTGSIWHSRPEEKLKVVPVAVHGVCIWCGNGLFQLAEKLCICRMLMGHHLLSISRHPSSCSGLALLLPGRGVGRAARGP